MPYRASQRTVLKILTKPHLIMRARNCLKNVSLRSIKENYHFHYLRITKRNISFINNSIVLREKIYSFHYTSISKLFDIGFVDLICDDGAVLWRSPTRPELSICLKQGNQEFRDGEIELQFRDTSKVIFVLGFTLVPKNTVHKGSDSGILITRVQGSISYLDFFKTVKTDLLDAGVNHLLFAALRGLSAYMGFITIYGVSTKFQSYYTEQRFDRFNKTYDDFWEALQGTKINEAFFMLPVPYVDKEITKIPQHHRSRVRKKRKFKDSVINSVFSQVILLNPNASNRLSHSRFNPQYQNNF